MTRTGDAGETALAGGQRLPKNAPRIAAYGEVDELNATVGAARAALAARRRTSAPLADLDATLLRVQHELFNLGSLLATLPADLRPEQARVTAEDIARLEEEIEVANSGLPALRSFVLPGPDALGAALHVCRAVCRRAERACVALARAEPVDADAVRYLNRLGDAFFVWSRLASAATGSPETLWDPNAASAGRRSRESTRPAKRRR